MIETKFKQTEVGLIPKDWEVCNIGSIANNFTGLTYSPNNVSKFGTLVLRSSNIQNDVLCFNDNVFVSMHIPDRAKAKLGDVLICVRNGSKELIGKSALVTANGMAFGAFMTVLRAQNINPKFLLFLWRSDFIQKQIKSSLGATINQITNADIKRYIVALPPAKEQNNIANVLTDIDSLLLSLDNLIAKKKAIKEGAMQQLLTGKKRLKGFDEPWVEKKIDDLFNLGNGYTPSKNVPAYWINGSIPWFRMEDIRTNGRILKDSIQHITPEAVKSGKLFPAFSIILSTTATIGEHALLIADSLANQQFTFLNRKVNREKMIDIMYFFHYCFILGKWCRDNINEGGLLAVNMDDLKNHIIKMPKSLIEQQAIAQVISNMDSEISAMEAKRKKYESVKQGMMQQLLTGKIRLTCTQKREALFYNRTSKRML